MVAHMFFTKLMDALFSSYANLGTKVPKNDATITRKKDDATVKNNLIGFHADFEWTIVPKSSFGYKKFHFRFRDEKLLGMKFKTLVDFASWNLLKEDDKVYEEEILEIKAKYGDAVTEDQIEGNTQISSFWSFSAFFLVIFGRNHQLLGHL